MAASPTPSVRSADHHPKGVRHQRRGGRGVDRPADDPPRERVEPHGAVHFALARGRSVPAGASRRSSARDLHVPRQVGDRPPPATESRLLTPRPTRTEARWAEPVYPESSSAISSRAMDLIASLRRR
jgi:hypothetical protein